jgi:molybdate transport system permease protein
MGGGLDLFPIGLSLGVASLATALTLVVGVPLAWVLARTRFPGRGVVEGLVVLPLVLPPTVLGYYLLLVIGRRGPVGAALAAIGIEIAFTWKAAVLAACVGSIALLVKAAQAGFETVDVQLEQAARTLGRSGWSVFWSVTLPLAWRSVLAGGVLAFCRALGEFGITLMVAGSIPGRTQTLPLAIYDRVQANQMSEANALALVAVGLVAVLVFGLGRLARVRL